ncbi:MAG: 50S ribosomal protein L19e [Candidatus Aenigmatarchaeota archaeon]
MNLRSQRKMAADLLDCGMSKVWIDPSRQEEVNEAITKDDMRSLIKKGAIKKKKEKEQSRGGARIRQSQKKKGRRSGSGRRKGKKKARKADKEKWMEKVRSLRKEIKKLRDNGVIESSTYRELYGMIKGNYFRRKSHLYNYLEERGIIEK